MDADFERRVEIPMTAGQKAPSETILGPLSAVADRLIQLHPADPIAIALPDIETGMELHMPGGGRFVAAERIPRAAPAARLDLELGAARIAVLPPSRDGPGEGAGARACCYEVGAEVAQKFRDDVVERRDGRLYLDIVNENECPSCSKRGFWSRILKSTLCVPSQKRISCIRIVEIRADRAGCLG